MLIRDKAELESQIKNKNLSESDADFLRKAYEEHVRSNAEPEDNSFADFKKQCIADGICAEDIETMWTAIQGAKKRESYKEPDAVLVEDIIAFVNNG